MTLDARIAEASGLGTSAVVLGPCLRCADNRIGMRGTSTVQAILSNYFFAVKEETKRVDR